MILLTIPSSSHMIILLIKTDGPLSSTHQVDAPQCTMYRTSIRNVRYNPYICNDRSTLNNLFCKARLPNSVGLPSIIVRDVTGTQQVPSHVNNNLFNWDVFMVPHPTRDRDPLIGFFVVGLSMIII